MSSQKNAPAPTCRRSSAGSAAARTPEASTIIATMTHPSIPRGETEDSAGEFCHCLVTDAPTEDGSRDCWVSVFRRCCRRELPPPLLQGCPGKRKAAQTEMQIVCVPSFVVMAGLVPAIHAAPLQTNFDVGSGFWAWMPGTRPGLTGQGCHDAGCVRLKICNRSCSTEQPRPCPGHDVEGRRAAQSHLRFVYDPRRHFLAAARAAHNDLAMITFMISLAPP